MYIIFILIGLYRFQNFHLSLFQADFLLISRKYPSESVVSSHDSEFGASWLPVIFQAQLE